MAKTAKRTEIKLSVGYQSRFSDDVHMAYGESILNLFLSLVYHIKS
ncbi:MAG: hypothetical protein ACPL1I_03750 [bacterium]